MNQGDLTRSENIQASWNPVSPAQAPNPSPQHGPINGILPRRDSESSGTEFLIVGSLIKILNFDMLY